MDRGANIEAVYKTLTDAGIIFVPENGGGVGGPMCPTRPWNRAWLKSLSSDREARSSTSVRDAETEDFLVFAIIPGKFQP